MKRALVKSWIAPLVCEPRHDAEPDDEALYGMTLEVLEALDGDWFRIKTPYRYESYCHGSDLCFDEAEIERYDRAEKRVVSAPTADVLTSESYQAPRVATVTRGALVALLGMDEEGKWAKLRLIGGAIGYTRQSHLGDYHVVPNGDEAQLRKNIVETAKTYLGAQYRWGGRTPLGIDCSGLASEAYRLNGVVIYRNADIKEGFPLREIPRGEMKSGDLLFYPGHVMIYLGNGKYIHATGRKGDDGVVINSLDPADADYREDLDKGMTAVGSIF